jgi:hypothetical protein
MSFLRVCGDEHGDTHLVPVELPEITSADGLGRRFGLAGIPTTTLSVGRLTEPKADQGLHTPPRRQVVVVLRGALEVTTTAGDRHRFGPGDCLLADDLGTKGHVTRDVGDEYLMTMTIGIPDDWKYDISPEIGGLRRK